MTPSTQTMTEKRRYVERRYKPSIIRELFKIPKNEVVIDFKWDRNNNVVVVETLEDFDYSKGDL